MTTPESTLDQLCVNTIRALAIDTVLKANSGHPGLPLGAAPVGYSLFARLDEAQPREPRAGPTATASCSRPATARRSSTACSTSRATTSRSTS